ncbi:MAG: excinuclease ABC subunit UvrA [Bdellovibrionales bacterium]|nr:excinuclease ABC subunit UvrA [Bdellovibrionales bacterium]
MESKYIHIKGARQHNLKGVDVKIPRDQLVVITGLSGSGKSSLAFDTIYAEGQRRYVESLSAYARQFLDRMEKPEVDSIEGLSPAISIDQRRSSKNPRSTVGTVTEIYDYLRLLFARTGKPFCYECGKAITSQSASQIVDQVLQLPEKTKIHILAPIARGKKGEFQKELLMLQKKGFTRVKIDGETFELSEKPKLEKNIKHNIDVFVDRLITKDGIRRRLADSIETALEAGEGLIKIEILGKDAKEILFSEHFACIDCGISYPEIEPRMFSFNNPQGACNECGGLGTKSYFDPALIVPNQSLSLRNGAIAPWKTRWGHFHMQTLESLAEHYNFDITRPWDKLSKKIQDIVLHGSGDEVISFVYDMEESSYTTEKPFEGVIPNLTRRFKETESETFREEMEEKYQGVVECPQCHGARLRKEALFIKVNKKSIADLSKLTIQEGFRFFQDLELSKKDQAIAEKILNEIKSRLAFLMNVGLDYLNLDRMAGTLSGGEAQRIRLATQIGSGLMGVLYILDEPSIGLHQRDNDRLLETLNYLKELGNTVLVVEHDQDTMMACDYIIDMGPGAGVEGGHVVAHGTPKQIIKSSKSITGKYLSGKKIIPVPKKRRLPDPKKWIEIKGANLNNLRDVDARFPIGLFTCVTGVSGSGKSTLVLDTLFPHLKQQLHNSKDRAGNITSISGTQYIDKVIDIDQSPIGRTPRSNPATYTGVFTPIRELFAQLPDAKLRGYKPGRFSFNVKGGRCETCQGDGILKIEMHFLPDVYVTCEACNGQRYNRETLDILYKGKSIAQVLDMSVKQAREFFENIPSIYEKLRCLEEVGLGYITLGQSAITLSGGEAQRIKLSRELSKRSTGKTFYILDEPTTGLHFEDVKKLLEVLSKLVDQGNSLLVIEHHLDVIKTADWIVDLGPEGGTHGGQIIASGTPEDLAKEKGSYTGKYLKPYLKTQESKKARSHVRRQSSAQATA